MNDKEFAEMARRFNYDLNEAMDLYILMIKTVAHAQQVQRRQGKDIKFFRVDRVARSVYLNDKAARYAVKVLRPDFTRREVRMVFDYYRELGWIKKPIKNGGKVGEVELNGKMCKVQSLKYGAANALEAFRNERRTKCKLTKE